MSESIFASIIEEMAEHELTEYSDIPMFKTSKKHDRAMHRIFKRYERNTQGLRPLAETKTRIVRKRIIVALVVIILAIFTGFTAAYFISEGFRGEVHRDNTELYPIDTENCPAVIEAKYYLPELPEGFEIVDTDSTPIYEYIAYENNQTGQTITFTQETKLNFDPMHLNSEKGKLVEVEINGHPGVFLDVGQSEYDQTLVVWDNGDYILQISGNLPKFSLIDLAKSTKILAK